MRRREREKRVSMLIKPEPGEMAVDRADVQKARVSQALWPSTIRRALPLKNIPLKPGKPPMLSRCRAWLAEIMSFSRRNPNARSHFLITPMPVDLPLVRVLETIDLSRTDTEDFFEEPGEERRTAELSLHRIDRVRFF